MSRSRTPRPDPMAGSWPVDTGRAELVPDGDGRRGWTLVRQRSAQQPLDLDDPTRIDFEYVQWFALRRRPRGSQGEPLRVTHLGGAGCTFARYVAGTRPESRQVARDRRRGPGRRQARVRPAVRPPAAAAGHGRPGGPGRPAGRRPGRRRPGRLQRRERALAPDHAGLPQRGAPRPRGRLTSTSPISPTTPSSRWRAGRPRRCSRRSRTWR